MQGSAQAEELATQQMAVLEASPCIGHETLWIVRPTCDRRQRCRPREPRPSSPRTLLHTGPCGVRTIGMFGGAVLCSRVARRRCQSHHDAHCQVSELRSRLENERMALRDSEDERAQLEAPSIACLWVGEMGAPSIAFLWRHLLPRET